jgi:exosortase/archaeosortase family protein
MSEGLAIQAASPKRWWRSAAGQFALKFMAIAAVGFGLYCFPYASDGAGEAFFKAYLSMYAHLAGSALSIVEPGVRVSGSVILGRSSMEIVKNCDAMEVIILFGAAVVATGGPWRRSVAALAAGVAALAAMNIFRICSLYFVAIHAPGAFEVVHLEVWPLLLIVFAVGMFAVCARWVRASDGHREPAAA